MNINKKRNKIENNMESTNTRDISWSTDQKRERKKDQQTNKMKTAQTLKS